MVSLLSKNNNKLEKQYSVFFLMFCLEIKKWTIDDEQIYKINKITKQAEKEKK